VVIQKTAALVAETHKVDLAKPDRVIIVEVFQVRKMRYLQMIPRMQYNVTLLWMLYYPSVGQMSVVGSDWETLKRYNVAELYPSASASASALARAGVSVKVATKPESVAADEAGSA
jgi:tRNA acetyltransferase TAN1